MTLIIKNITYKIRNHVILDDISFEVKAGETLVLLGPSGCGKSTTLRMIAGLEKPTGGFIIIDQNDLTNQSPVTREVGMVFQSYALFPHLNVCDNLSLGLKIRGESDNQIKNKVNNILNLMQIDHLRYRKPQDLSGGQKQRIALARALIRNPKIYLLDEPMSNLDAQLRDDLRPELRRFIHESSNPVIYVTHDQEEALSMANKIGVMKNGRIIQLDDPQTIYRKPNSIFVASFIGRPQINLLNISKNIITGVRPENVIFDESGIRCKLLFKEWLGKNQVLHFDTKFGSIRMLIPSNEEIPDRINISWLPGNEILFDSRTNKRLYNGE